jgi:hypothetical protein
VLRNRSDLRVVTNFSAPAKKDDDPLALEEPS